MFVGHMFTTYSPEGKREEEKGAAHGISTPLACFYNILLCVLLIVVCYILAGYFELSFWSFQYFIIYFVMEYPQFYVII